MKYAKLILAMLTITVIAGCSTSPNTFGDDVNFLKKHTDVIVLSDRSGQSQIAVVPQYQGRVMTSTAAGPDGDSYGFLKYDLIKSKTTEEHINSYGGEDRFWIGPEGGQFSIFFAKDKSFDIENWYTPAVIDTEAYRLTSQSPSKLSFTKNTKLTNYSGTQFDLRINRTVQMISRDFAAINLGARIPATVNVVGYQTVNKITNIGTEAWKKDTGLLSIWILGMFKHSPDTTVVIPFVPGTESRLGPIVNDEYFGKVPAERLIVKDKALFFKADGEYRSKIGLAPSRARPVAGSYDAGSGQLTIVMYTKPAGAKDYVNSMWELQEKPYGGDVVNSYNDGPNDLGEDAFGPFYELETSSPAAALKPNESLTHTHKTIHLQGPEKDLDNIAKIVLGVSIEDIKTAIQ